MEHKLSAAYAAMVEMKLKPGHMVVSIMTATKANLAHCAMGIAGEAGELLDAIKKHVIYGKELDLANVIEELGDLEFYMQGLRNTLELERGFILQQNMYKLDQRYRAEYTDAEAALRRDKL